METETGFIRNVAKDVGCDTKDARISTYKGKKYYWIHIDPACYEYIILDLLREN